MSTLVVVESLFGNTRAVADAIAAARPGATVVAAADAPTDLSTYDLVVVGAPTHNMSLPSRGSRRTAASRGVGAPDRGVREWAADVSAPPTRAVTFDTSTRGGTLLGSARKTAARALRRRGVAAVAGESFLVAGAPPRLADGELERAAAWGASL